jgi:lipoprotein-anchoring transpeptidase ErfK/SrfK
VVVVVVLLVAAAVGGGYALGQRGGGSNVAGSDSAASDGTTPSPATTTGQGAATSTSTSTTSTTLAPKPLTLVSSQPAVGAQDVPSDSTLALSFSAPVSVHGVQPTLSPTIPGTWAQASATTIQFQPSAPLLPSSSVTITIPGGTSGLRATDGGMLPASVKVSFQVAVGSTLRLQQLLADLNFLPLSFTSSGPAPAPNEMAMPQAGSFAWRWAGLPADLTSLWQPSNVDVITKGAIMNFENQNGMAVDGVAGPAVWTALLKDVAANTINTASYDYVYVSKTLPENLTVYVNGNPQYTNIAVNTGAPGADTVDGTYPVFEHVTSSRMVGTNPDGSTYDDPDVPWASFFNGGDALHGFVRATYGTPQSNGCVEMTVADAQTLWPLTPIGTLVTVVGPAS